MLQSMVLRSHTLPLDIETYLTLSNIVDLLKASTLPLRGIVLPSLALTLPLLCPLSAFSAMYSLDQEKLPSENYPYPSLQEITLIFLQ